MPEHPLEDFFARLERERRQADRSYNDALLALERAVLTPPGLPEPPPLFQPTPVNDAPEGPVKGAIARVRELLWRILGTSSHMEQRFHDLVEHAHWSAELRHTIVALLAAERRALGVESLLVQHLQTIARYVEAKDDEIAGSDMRDRLLLVEQRLVALKRDIETRQTDTARQRSRLDGPGATAPSPEASPAHGAVAEHVDAASYVGFEGRFRGSRDDISRRVEDYIPLFTGAPAPVLDVGCGRGELLELLRTNGIPARGIDSNPAMVDGCLSRGLEAEESDALAYLSKQPDGSLGGLAAIQVVEHFEPGYLARFLDMAQQKLRPGSVLVLETINPACWVAFFESYIRDLTHKRPLHPETLRYLVEAAGFTGVNVQFREPVPEADRLDRVTVGDPADSVVRALNAHADKLNRRLFSSMDYAIVARR